MSIEYPCVHWSDGRCKKFSDDKVTSWCVESPCDDQAPSNADRIRSMNDELLATQFVQVFKEGIKVLTDMDMPEELLDKFWNSFLERLKQPAEE